jgi:hypothetical protein
MRIATVLAVYAMVGCGPTAPGDGSQQDASPLGPQADAEPAAACDKMDLLFIIDNSGSMAQEQDNLADNFPLFVSVLEEFRNADGSPIDYHVGITTTGVSKTTHQEILGVPITDTMNGEDGNLQIGDDCGLPRRWLERDDPAVSDAFSCAAAVGTGGPDIEMPLEGARLALTERMVADQNLGFLREDALLALVFLTDEEDCSRTDDDIELGLTESLCDEPEGTATYLAAFDAVKGARARWAAAIIAGVDPDPCSSDLGDAQPATRLTEFAAAIGSNAVTSSICEGDLASALGAAMAKFQEACNDLGDVE